MLSSSITISDLPQPLPSYERLAPKDDVIPNEIDKDFLIEKQVNTFFESIGVNISTLLSYISIPVLANAAHRWPEILNEAQSLIENSIYDVCNINKEIRQGIVRDGATLATEATSYTTFLVILAFGLLIPNGFYKFFQFLRRRPDLKELRTKLKKFNFKIRSKFFDLTKEQINAVLDRINSVYQSNSIVPEIGPVNFDEQNYKNLQTALKIQFGSLTQREIRQLTEELSANNYVNELFPAHDIPLNTWQRFCKQTQWFRGELGRYMKPIALVALIPGILKTINSSRLIAESTGCGISTVFTDDCDAVKEVDVMSQEIWIWMYVSFSLLFFYGGMTFLNGITYPFQSFTKLRNLIYKFHKPLEKWATNEDRWLYKELVWRAISPITLSATMIYSIWESVYFANRYAEAAGCDSLGHTIKDIYTESNSLQCTAATKGMIIATFVGACELGKFYTLFVTQFFGIYTLTHIKEKLFNFKKRFNKEKVNNLIDDLIEQDKTSMQCAGVGIFLSGAANLITAKHFGDQVLHGGIKVAKPIPTNLNATIAELNYFENNNSTQAFYQEICPEDDFVSVLNQHFGSQFTQNTTINAIFEFLNTTASWKSPLVVINNNTLIFTLAEACLNTELINTLFTNILYNDPNCNELVTIRSLGAAIAFFYLNASLTGAVFYFFSSIVQRVNYFCKLLSCYQANTERSQEEAVIIPVNIITKEDELKEPLLETPSVAPRRKLSCGQILWQRLFGKPSSEKKSACVSWNFFRKRQHIVASINEGDTPSLLLRR